MTQANSYLSWLLDFCFDNDVSFTTKTWDMLPNDYAMQRRCLEHRKCCICGKHADVAHVETIGMGRNRKHINHSGYYFMVLCRIHHIEQHKIGIHSFLQKYHIKPIKMVLRMILRESNIFENQLRKIRTLLIEIK